MEVVQTCDGVPAPVELYPQELRRTCWTGIAASALLCRAARYWPAAVFSWGFRAVLEAMGQPRPIRELIYAAF